MELKCEFNGESAERESDSERPNRRRANDGGYEPDIQMTAMVHFRGQELAATAI